MVLGRNRSNRFTFFNIKSTYCCDFGQEPHQYLGDNRLITHCCTLNCCTVKTATIGHLMIVAINNYSTSGDSNFLGITTFKCIQFFIHGFVPVIVSQSLLEMNWIRFSTHRTHHTEILWGNTCVGNTFHNFSISIDSSVHFIVFVS